MSYILPEKDHHDKQRRNLPDHHDKKRCNLQEDEESFHDKKRRYKKRARYLEKTAPVLSDTLVFNRKAITEVIGRLVFEILSKDDSPEVQLWLDSGCQFYIGEDTVGRLGNNGILSMACFNHRIPESVYCSIHDPVTRTARNDKRAKNTVSRKGKKQKKS